MQSVKDGDRWGVSEKRRVLRETRPFCRQWMVSEAVMGRVEFFSHYAFLILHPRLSFRYTSPTGSTRGEYDEETRRVPIERQ